MFWKRNSTRTYPQPVARPAALHSHGELPAKQKCQAHTRTIRARWTNQRQSPGCHSLVLALRPGADLDVRMQRVEEAQEALCAWSVTGRSWAQGEDQKQPLILPSHPITKDQPMRLWIPRATACQLDVPYLRTPSSSLASSSGVHMLLTYTRDARVQDARVQDEARKGEEMQPMYSLRHPPPHPGLGASAQKPAAWCGWCRARSQPQPSPHADLQVKTNTRVSVRSDR